MHNSNPQIELTDVAKTAKGYYFEHTLPQYIHASAEKLWYLAGKKKPINPMIHEGALLVDETEIAEQFNRHFHSVFLVLNPCTFCSDAFCFSDPGIVYLSGLTSILLNLKTKSSPGPDRIPNIFLRHYAEAISKFPAKIFRTSFATGKLPSDWRTPCVVPVPKKGDRTFLLIYCPISLTSTCNAEFQWQIWIKFFCSVWSNHIPIAEWKRKVVCSNGRSGSGADTGSLRESRNIHSAEIGRFDRNPA